MPPPVIFGANVDPLTLPADRALRQACVVLTEVRQYEIFAEEVVPAVRDALATSPLR
ncbi:hypothetical protein [Actinoallomurus sp. NPDC052274]|uniref:hypothetical protein n=1 Tax=Actinoallomurus sp. NPDC052274 TaxID=3155420 RepID=UPI0034340E3A